MWHEVDHLWGFLFPYAIKWGVRFPKQWSLSASVSTVSKTMSKIFQVPGPVVVSEKVLWKLTLYCSYPLAETLCFHAFIKGHISIILIGINSCSINLLQNRRLAAQRTKGEARKQWLADLDSSRSGMAFGPSAFLSSRECGCPGSSPKPSSFPSQSLGRITMRTRAIAAETRLWILKYTLGRS